MSVSVIYKDPDSDLDYVFNWTDSFLEAGENIASYTLKIDPGLTIVSQSEGGGLVRVVVSGGEPETNYQILCHIETDATPVRKEDAVLVVVVRQTEHKEMAPSFFPMFDSDDTDMRAWADVLRRFTRDQLSRNQLYMQARWEHEWEDIFRALEFTLDDWNGTPPFTSHTIEKTTELDPIGNYIYRTKGLTKRARACMLYGAAAHLLESAAHEQARNEIQYNDQGFSVVEYGKTQQYLTIAAQLRGKYDTDKAKIKSAESIQDSFGGVYHPVTGFIYGGFTEPDGETWGF